MKAILTLFLIVFIDLLGFGIIIPLFPFVAERMGADPWLITFGGAGVYALAQVIATPFWGRLSDAIGRKPVLVVSMLGAVFGYLWLAFADSLAMLIAARVLSGLMSGNISAAFAYVADVTDPSNRAKGLGMIGAAFGLGFMFGPMIGGLLGGDDPATASFLVPGLVSAALSAIAFLGAMFLLKESLPPENRKPWRESGRGLRSPLASVSHSKVLLGLVGAVFLVSIGGTILQSIFPIWGHDVLGLSPRDVGLAFFAMGFVGVTVQGVVVGRLATRFGEKRVLYGSALLHAIGYITMGLASDHVMLALGAAFFAAGHASFNTTASSLVTLEAGAREKGAALGAMQSASAAGRIVGPASSGAIYSGFGTHAPFLVGAVLLVPAVMLLRRSHKGDQPHTDEAPGTPGN
jgi:DHA1 family tetracycline resistance protein-like MFS transporter